MQLCYKDNLFSLRFGSCKMRVRVDDVARKVQCLFVFLAREIDLN